MLVRGRAPSPSRSSQARQEHGTRLIMTIAQQTPAAESAPPTCGTWRNGRWAGFRQVLSVRMKELRREPEVIFWVFGFPILLALGLGIAFRNKPADLTSIVIVESGDAQRVANAVQTKNSAIHVQVEGREAALEGLRLGKYDLA